MNESYAEPTTFDETNPSRKPSSSTKLLQTLQVGEPQRIFHYDVKCYMAPSGMRACTLNHTLLRLRKKGWTIRSYHEAHNIMVVERLA